MVVVKSPSRINEDRRRMGKPYMNYAQRQQAEKRYRNYRLAKRVWRQISDEERVWLLTQFGYEDPVAANERDENHDLRELRLSDKQLRDIKEYPRSEHRQAIYRKKLAAGSPRQDVRVRAHEKRLRKKGLRRPW